MLEPRRITGAKEALFLEEGSSVSCSIMMLVSKVDKQREQEQRPLLEWLIRFYLSSFLGGWLWGFEGPCTC